MLPFASTRSLFREAVESLERADFSCSFLSIVRAIEPVSDEPSDLLMLPAPLNIPDLYKRVGEYTQMVILLKPVLGNKVGAKMKNNIEAY